MDMARFTVYQINFTREEVDMINSGGLHNEYSMYLDTICCPTMAAIEKARSLYKPVAEIVAEDLEDVFHIGNMGPENKIKRLREMHSLSVGDVIKDEQGNAVYVDTFGFQAVAAFQD
jgi:hypothetical protein